VTLTQPNATPNSVSVIWQRRVITPAGNVAQVSILRFFNSDKKFSDV
jgi:hypothetical protein